MSLSKEEMRKLLWCQVCFSRSTANLKGICHECLGGNRLVRTEKGPDLIHNTTKEAQESYERQKERIRKDLLRMGEEEKKCPACDKEYFGQRNVPDCPDCRRRMQDDRKTKLYEESLGFS